MPVIADARFKIIQKNREKLTDARDKLAQIAKQSDARLKLDKLRATHSKPIESPLTGIYRQTGINGRISLTTNKAHHKPQHQVPTANYLPPSTRSIGYRAMPMVEPSYVDEMEVNFNDGTETLVLLRFSLTIFPLLNSLIHSFRIHDRIAASETDGEQRVRTYAASAAACVQYQTLCYLYLGKTTR